jgi:hypothetical protein
MAHAINRHDARALALIDRALMDGRFTAESVAEIHRALEAAQRAEGQPESGAPDWTRRRAA